MDRSGVEEMDNLIKVYFAGPDVFRNDVLNYFDTVSLMCDSVFPNIYPIYPIDNSIESKDSKIIYDINVEKIKQSDCIVAYLTPFRGISADVGTCVEIGMAVAFKKHIVGYYDGWMPEKYKDRVSDYYDIVSDYYDWETELFPVVEDFDLYDNLMVCHSCASIETSLYDALKKITEMSKTWQI